MAQEENSPRVIMTASEMVKIHEESVIEIKELVELFNTIRELCDVVGLSGKVKDIVSEFERIIEKHTNILGKTGERKTCAIFDMLVFSDESPIKQITHSDVVSVAKEVSIPCGIVDRLLRHEDGSVTIVEIKPRGSRRDHACGIGQSLVYAACAREFLGVSEVRSALFVSGEFDPWISLACSTAGVGYMHIPMLAEKFIVQFAEAASAK